MMKRQSDDTIMLATSELKTGVAGGLGTARDGGGLWASSNLSLDRMQMRFSLSSQGKGQMLSLSSASMGK
jgi:hypothetical protein